MSKFMDLTGQIFGKLKVLEIAPPIYDGSKKSKKLAYKCICECGNKPIIRKHSLTSGNTKSCGCSRKIMLNERNKKLGIKNIKNLAGKIFGRWTVIEYTKSHNRGSRWLCHCSCGTIKEDVSGHALSRGESKSCGCLKKESDRRFKDLTGQKFGKLTVIERVDKPNSRSIYWLCQCSCSAKTMKVIRGDSLKTTRSCGCLSRTLNGLTKDKAAYRRLRNQDPMIRIRSNIGRIIGHALKGRKNGKSAFKHLSYNINDLKNHLESQFEPWMSWDNYGGNSDDPRKTWHLDHIIPQSKFYYLSMEDDDFKKCWALSNLQPLDKIENISKGNRAIAPKRK